VQMVYCESCGASNPGDAQQCFACHRSLTDAEPTEEPPKQRPTTNENEIEHPAIPEERYKILACVGTGGFGAVYKARAIQDNNRLVAIKEIRLRNLKPQEIIEATVANSLWTRCWQLVRNSVTC
jgi:serine/threonine protein kinase